MEIAPKGLTEDTIRLISARKQEPEWLLAWRLKAFAAWQRDGRAALGASCTTRRSTTRTSTTTPRPSAPPDRRASTRSIPSCCATYEKLGIPLKERAILAGVEGAGVERTGIAQSANVAVDAVFDSVSVATTFRATLAEAGVIFCPISEAVREHPDLVRAAISAASCRRPTTTSRR